MAFKAHSPLYAAWTLRDGAERFSYYAHGGSGMLFLSQCGERLRKAHFVSSEWSRSEQEARAFEELRAVRRAEWFWFTNRFVAGPIRHTPNARIFDDRGVDVSEMFAMAPSFEMALIRSGGLTETKAGGRFGPLGEKVGRRFRLIGIRDLSDATTWIDINGETQKVVDFSFSKS